MTGAGSGFSRRAGLVFGVVTLALAGCENLIGPPAAPRIYRLEPAFPTAAPGARVAWQLAIARPQTMHTLDTERIALSRGETMDYYADAEWNDTVPRLLQSLLVQAFETSGRIGAVAAETESMRADYLLTTDIRDFEAQYDDPNGAPVATVRIAAKLLDTRGKVLAATDVQRKTPSGQNSVPAVVAAFDAALGGDLEQIVEWVFHSLPS